MSSDNSWENSQECEDWHDAGARDEDYEYYYNKWHNRVNR